MPGEQLFNVVGGVRAGVCPWFWAPDNCRDSLQRILESGSGAGSGPLYPNNKYKTNAIRIIMLSIISKKTFFYRRAAYRKCSEGGISLGFYPVFYWKFARDWESLTKHQEELSTGPDIKFSQRDKLHLDLFILHPILIMEILKLKWIEERSFDIKHYNVLVIVANVS